MKTLAWNCRGLGTPGAVNSLRRLLFSVSPDLVFLMETKKKDCEMLNLRGIGGMYNIFPVSCTGFGTSKAGGLCLLWNDNIEVDVLSMSLNHIQFWVKNTDGSQKSLASAIYSFP